MCRLSCPFIRVGLTLQLSGSETPVVPDIVLCLNVLEHDELHLIDSVKPIYVHFDNFVTVVDLQPAVKYFLMAAPTYYLLLRNGGFSFRQFFPCLTTLTLNLSISISKVVIVAAHEAALYVFVTN